MRVAESDYTTVWMSGTTVLMIDQNQLPYTFAIHECKNYFDTCLAISNMIIRGAGAIGAASGFAMAQAFLEAPEEDFWDFINQAKTDIETTRPTARNLFFAVGEVYKAGRVSVENAVSKARDLADKDARDSLAIGRFGNELIESGFRIATHCNAVWLAFVDYGTALSPIYLAHRSGKKLVVYVDETRPRLQGSKLTAWELKNEGIPHFIIPDNALAYLMQRGEIDLMIVGADRVALNGDVANKIGTLEKAVIAREFGVPFYVAAPLSTFDVACKTGKDVVIEFRDEKEVLEQTGIDKAGNLSTVLLANPGSIALNPAFDITPAKYIKGIITERGIVKPNRREIEDFLKNFSIY